MLGVAVDVGSRRNRGGRDTRFDVVLLREESGEEAGGAGRGGLGRLQGLGLLDPDRGREELRSGLAGHGKPSGAWWGGGGDEKDGTACLKFRVGLD